MFSNNKGITMTECLIAILLTAVAIVSLMPMQDNALKVMSRSDYLGRAAGIMQSELESEENRILNFQDNPGVNTPFIQVCCDPILACPVVVNKTVTVSGSAGVPGDATFTINTKRTLQTPNTCIMSVNVTWTGNTTGINSSVITSRLN